MIRNTAPLISIRDNTDTQIGVLTDYFNDSIEKFLEGKVSILTVSVLDEKKNRELLSEGNSLSFTYNGEDYHLTIVKKEEDEDVITATCWSLVLELNNETKDPFIGSNMTFAQYLNSFDGEKILTLNINEVSDKQISHTWDSQQSMLERLFSLATVFNAELEFNTILAEDGSLKELQVNVYKAHDTSNQGLGKDRSSEVFYFGEDITTVKKVTAITNLYTVVRPVGKDGLTLNGYKMNDILDEKGEVLYYLKNNGLYAPQARTKYPSNLINKGDRWIVYDWQTEYTTQASLAGNALTKLKQLSQPQTTWTIEGYIDANIGDTISVNDNGYTPSLLLTARINSQKICMTDPSINETTFSNVEQIQSEISEDLIARMNQLIAENEKYELEISTNNGVMFKNSIGSTTLTAKVFKGGQDLTSAVELKWFKNSVSFNNPTNSLTINAKDITVAMFRIEAWTNDVLRASNEVTLTNIDETKIVRQDTAPDGDQNTIWIDSSQQTNDLDIAKIYNNLNNSWIAITPKNPDQIGAVSNQDFLNALKIQAEIKKSVEDLGKDVQAIQNDVDLAEETLNEYKNFKDGITQKVDNQKAEIETVIKSTNDNKTAINSLTQTSDSLSSTIGKLESDTTTKISQLEQTTDSIKLTVANKADSKDVASQIKQSADSITQTVSEKYPTKDQVASQISQKADSITQTVASTYQPKGDYATTGYVASQIKQTSDSITSTISTNMSNTYSTKSDTQSKVNAVQANIDSLGTNIAYNWNEDGTDRFTRDKPNENLWSISNSILGKFQDWSSGLSLLNNPARFTSDFLPVKEGEEYWISSNYASYNFSVFLYKDTSSNAGLRLNDSNKNGASWVTLSSNGGGISSGGFKIPSGYSYMRLSANVTNSDIATPDLIVSRKVKLEKSDKATIYTPNPKDDYDNAVPRYIGRSLKDSTNPADFKFEPNPDRKPWTVYAKDLNGEGLSLMPYGENLILGTASPFTITGNNTSNQGYILYKFAKASFKDFGFKEGDIVTLSFDWSTTASSGSFRPEINTTPWSYGSVLKATGTNGDTYYGTDISSSKKSGTVTLNYRITSESAVADTAYPKVRFDYLESGKTFTIKNYKLEVSNLMNIPTPWIPAPSEDPLGAIPKYVGTAAFPYEDFSKYTWDLNPEWLKVNTETLVSNQYSQSVQDLDGFKNTVGATYQTKDAMSGYYNKNQVDSAIVQKAGEITSTVSSIYETKTNSNSNLSTAKSYADTQSTNAKNSAVSTASADATTKSNNALSSAKTYADSQIKQTADSITSTVSKLSQADNLVAKPTFEDGEIGNWTSGALDTKIYTPDETSSSYSRLLKWSTRDNYEDRWFDVRAGETYYFEAYLSAWSANYTVRFGFNLQDSTGANSWQTPVSVPKGTGLSLAKGSYTIPTDSKYIKARPFLQIEGFSNVGVALAVGMRITRSVNKETLDSQIQQTSDSITLSVSQTYETKSNVANNLTTAKSYADTQANNAKTAAVTESKTYTESQIEQTANQIRATVNTKVTDEAYNTANTGGENGNKWTRFLRTTITNQYADMQVSLDIIGQGTGDSQTRNASLYVRHKQQGAMGSATSVTMDLVNSTFLIDTDIKAVVTTNSSSAVIVDYYVYINTSYTGLRITPITKSGGGTIEYISNTSFGGLPSGSQTFTAQYNGSLGNAKDALQKYASLKITTDDISTEVGKKVGKSEVISTINQSAESVSISASKINLAGAVTISSLATDARNRLDTAYNTSNTANSAAGTAQSKADSAYNLANTANGTANTANNQVNSWKKSGTTKIDGGNISADSISVISTNTGNLNINGDLKGWSGSSQVSLLNKDSLNFYKTDGSNTFTLNASGISNINNGYGTRNIDFFSEGVNIWAGSSNTGNNKNSGLRLVGNAGYVDLLSSASTSNTDVSLRLISESNGNGGINNHKGTLYFNSNKGIILNPDSGGVSIQAPLNMAGNNITGAGGLIGTTATGGWPITMMNIQGITGTPYLNVTSGSRSWGINMWTSDMKLKKNIKKTKGKALDIVDKLMVRQFDWHDYDKHTDFGLIAQNVERVLPQAVFNVEQRDSQSIKQISADGVIPVLVQAIQELQQEIKQLKL